MNTFYLKKNIFQFLLLVLMLSCGQVFAQTEDGGVIQKRNYLPNPKVKTKSPEKTVEIFVANTQKNEPQIIPEETPAPKVESNILNGSETANPAEGESSANKLVAIAKERNRASRVINKLPTELYRIGSGDTLDIRLLNAQTKESSLFTVLDNGLIDYPLAGTEPISVLGLTTDEIKDILTDKIKLFENPEVSVGIRSYASHKITILGLVEKQGEKTLRREAVPFYAVLSEAIPSQTANQATILRADKQTVTIDLSSQADLDTLVYQGDIIKISSVSAFNTQAQFYYISGNITSAGEKSFRAGLTLTQAIMANGNVTKSATKAIIFRQNNAGLLVSTEANIKQILEGKVPDVALLAGDRIEIKK